MTNIQQGIVLSMLFHVFCAEVVAQRSSSPETKRLIYSADFTKPLNKNDWIIEIKSDPQLAVRTKEGKLVIDTKEGVTVWLNKLLKGNIQIEYARRVVIKGNSNDRLSDLNQFWMAKYVLNKNLFTRDGTFNQYDSLQLYYVGMGGNSNTTTRFRKYDNEGNKTLLQEYKDALHLLQPNRTYRIKIMVYNNVTSFWVDDECYFIYNDPVPLQEGYFGFRLLHSRQEIENFRIYQLP